MSIREQLDAIFQPLQEINLEGQITLEEGQRGLANRAISFADGRQNTTRRLP